MIEYQKITSSKNIFGIHNYSIVHCSLRFRIRWIVSKISKLNCEHDRILASIFITLIHTTDYLIKQCYIVVTISLHNIKYSR